MEEEQRGWKLLGQRYRDFGNLRLCGSVFRDRHGAFGWLLNWFDIQRTRILGDWYWFDRCDFYEVITHDDPDIFSWESGKKLVAGSVYKEAEVYGAITTWEIEERERD